MGSGMNLEQAKELASKRSYSWAVGNIITGKGIKYRKATMIKLRELAEIADRLDKADTPQTEQTEPTCSQLATNLQPTEPSGYKMKPLEQTESRDLAQDLATGKESILSIAIKGKMERRGKQTDCPWK